MIMICVGKAHAFWSINVLVPVNQLYEVKPGTILTVICAIIL